LKTIANQKRLPGPPQPLTPSQRNSQLDMLRGVGIILVVVTHVFMLSTGKFDAFTRVTYLFHMPLFFFLAGYLSPVRKEFGSFFVSKLRQFGIPYMAYFFVVFVLNKLVGANDVGLKQAFWGGGSLYGFLGAFWFIPVFFLSQQLGNFVLAKCNVTNAIIIASGLLAIAYVNEAYFGKVQFPQNANVTFAAAPFYIVGNLLKGFKFDRWIAIPVVFALIGLYFATAGDNAHFNMKNAIYGIPVVSFLASLGCIITLIYLFNRLPSFRPLVEIGKASLVILYLHQCIQIFLFNHVAQNVALRIVCATVLPLIVYYVAMNEPRLKMILLGIGDKKKA
jgi:fucose 4-O-acetylase-like acetyltransferase